MIDFKEIPDWWALCPGYECPRAGECLRHQAFLQVPATVERWTCVLPAALETAGGCRHFQQAEKVRMARGFHGIMQQVRSRDARHDIRIALTDYFGSKGSYYRYKDGERQMSPEQQQWVEALLRKNGITGELVFDEYEETYDFTRR